jgi:hypothetical protein
MALRAIPPEGRRSAREMKLWQLKPSQAYFELLKARRGV